MRRSVKMRGALHSLTLKLALPLVLLGLAACGSSNNTTTTSPTAAANNPTTGANSVCATFNTSINAVRPTPAADPATADAASLPAIAQWIDAVLPMAMQEQQTLSVAPDAGSLNATFADVITTFRAAGIAAKGTDAAAFQTEWAKFVAAQKAFHDAATAGNFPDCAK